jgi:NAD(P)H dehydrogenase (quinone)
MPPRSAAGFAPVIACSWSVCTSLAERRICAHRTFIEAAAACSVGVITYLSMIGASAASAFPHSVTHHATEVLLAAAGVPSIALRMNLFLDDLPLWFDADGVCRGPAGDGRVALVTRADVAGVAASVLRSDAYDSATLDVTGERAFSLAQLAAIASERLARELRYQPGSREQYLDSRRALGRAAWDAEAGVGCYLAIGAGELAVTSTVLRTITGRAPERVSDWVSAHPDAFQRTGDRENRRRVRA